MMSWPSAKKPRWGRLLSPPYAPATPTTRDTTNDTHQQPKRTSKAPNQPPKQDRGPARQTGHRVDVPLCPVPLCLVPYAWYPRTLPQHHKNTTTTPGTPMPGTLCPAPYARDPTGHHPPPRDLGRSRGRGGWGAAAGLVTKAWWGIGGGGEAPPMPDQWGFLAGGHIIVRTPPPENC